MQRVRLVESREADPAGDADALPFDVDAPRIVDELGA